MRICVFGAGAIGGVIAAALKLAGNEVCAVARGEHLAAIRKSGLRIEAGGETRVVELPASDSPGDFGRQDAVITTVKAHALPAAAPLLEPLLGPDTSVVYGINGIPWWYFHGAGGRFDGRRIELLDPEAGLWREVGVERTIGCVVNFSSTNPAPGLVRRTGVRNRLLLGEPNGDSSERLGAVSSVLSEAGFVVETGTPIREVIWSKLRRGAISSAFATLTAAPAGAALGMDDLRRIFREAMLELTAVAAAHGVKLEDDIEAQMADLAASRHSPSMLQDLEKGRAMEIDAQLSAPQHLARLADVETPTIDVIAALVRARAASAGLYKP